MNLSEYMEKFNSPIINASLIFNFFIKTQKIKILLYKSFLVKISAFNFIYLIK